MKKYFILLLSFIIQNGFSQTETEVEYKQASLANGIQSGTIENINNVSQVNIIYDFSNMVIAAKSTGGTGHITEETYLKLKAASLEAEEKGTGALFLQNWENGKKTDWPQAFEKLFNQYAIDDIKMSGKNNTTSADYNLIVRTTKIEPGWTKGVVIMSPYIDVEFIFTDKAGKELLTVFFKAILPSKVGAPVWALFRKITPSYEKAAKKLADYLKDMRKKG